MMSRMVFVSHAARSFSDRLLIMSSGPQDLDLRQVMKILGISGREKAL